MSTKKDLLLNECEAHAATRFKLAAALAAQERAEAAVQTMAADFLISKGKAEALRADNARLTSALASAREEERLRISRALEQRVSNDIPADPYKAGYRAGLWDAATFASQSTTEPAQTEG